MPHRTYHSKRLHHAGLTAVLTLMLALPLCGQAPPPVSPAQFDPSEVYFQGYLATRSSEQLEAEGNFIGAAEKLAKAQQLFGAVQKYYPNWKPEMVKVRSDKTDEAIRILKTKSEEQLQKNRNQVAELEGGVRKSGRLIDPKEANSLTPNILEVDPIAARRLKEAEAEVKRLKTLVSQGQSKAEDEANRAKALASQSQSKAEAEVSRLKASQTQAEAELNRLKSLSQNQSETEAELNRLKSSQAKAEAELNRLKSSQSQAEDEVARLKSIASQSQSQAEAEVNRLKTSQSKAEAEVARLKSLASKSQSQAEAEAKRAKSSQSETEAELKRLRSLANQSQSEAEAEVKRLKTSQAEAEAELKRLKSLASQSQSEAEAEVKRVKASQSQAEAELQRLRALAAQNQSQAEVEANRLKELASQNQNERSRDSTRLDDIKRQRDSLQNDLLAAQNNVEALRSRLAAAPLEKDLKSLNQRIETLEQEREAMAMALTQSRSSHTEALARVATLEADLKVVQQKHSDLDRDLKTERKVTNSVVVGQRRQLEALEKELTNKNTELTKANEKINGLVTELQESHDAFAQLRTERDSLLQERDQMSKLLKINEPGRIQDLIEQNMAYAKNLREANEKLDRMNRESNADKDSINAAIRDLAIAKSQINRLHQDKRDQEKRLADLEARLKSEELALSKQKPDADPAEVEMLRDIIKRQLRVQESRRQARALLVEAAKDLGTKDERLANAIALFDGQEIALSLDEQKLVANKQVDGEFVSPSFARDHAAVSKSTADLDRDIAVFERTAEKSFVSGRLLPTRELYQMILEQNPGHTPTLCRLGVVHLKLNDPAVAVDTFRRAVELDANNPYAHRMLGFAMMQTGDIPAAEQAVRHSVELAPNDAKSLTLLATLCHTLGKTGEAESFFKAAITADPVPSEPYYNLARICARNKRYDLAKEYYQQALDRGAVPDINLEKTLDKH
ncbi:MAG: tetratricopeptide repeat protein [Verrucomicrobiota bacterium]